MNARANHAAKIFAATRNAVECGRRPEIDGDDGAAEQFKCGDRVHDAVRAYFVGVLIADRHARSHARSDDLRRRAEELRRDALPDGDNRRHNAREDHVCDFFGGASFGPEESDDRNDHLIRSLLAMG